MPESQVSTAIDKLAVLAKEKIQNLERYNAEITTINNNLTNAKAQLAGTPGVQVAVAAIDQSIQENYKRGYAYQEAVKAEQTMVLQIQEIYNQFAQVVDNLQHPEPAQTQLQIGNSQSSNSNDNPEIIEG